MADEYKEIKSTQISTYQNMHGIMHGKKHA